MTPTKPDTYTTVIDELDVDIEFFAEAGTLQTHNEPGSPPFMEILSVKVNGKIDIFDALSQKEVEALAEEVIENIQYEDMAYPDHEMSED